MLLSFFKILFIYFWLCWVLVSVRGLSPVAASGGHSSSRCGDHSSSRCVGLSLSRPLVAGHRLQTHRLSNCGSWAQLLRSMWDLPRPGLEPVSPALAGGFSTTAPAGKPLTFFFEQGKIVLVYLNNKIGRNSHRFETFNNHGKLYLLNIKPIFRPKKTEFLKEIGDKRT